jgi:hypothetical protein
MVCYLSCCIISLSLPICTYLPQLPRTLHINSVLVPRVYSQVIVTHSLFSFSLHCWEEPASKHFTVSPHLLFKKHVTNANWFELPVMGRASSLRQSRASCLEQSFLSWAEPPVLDNAEPTVLGRAELPVLGRASSLRQCSASSLRQSRASCLGQRLQS